MKRKWEIIHDADDDDGNPTNWALEINHYKYGKYVWICKYDENEFKIEVNYGDFIDLVTCKSLTSAKRWVAMNLL